MALVNISLHIYLVLNIISSKGTKNYLSNLYHTDSYAPYLSNPSRIKEIRFKDYKFEFERGVLPEQPVSKIDIITTDDTPILIEFISYLHGNDVRSYYYTLNSKTAKLDNYCNDIGTVLQDPSSLCYYPKDSGSDILNNLSDFVLNLDGLKTTRSIEGILLVIEVESEETASIITSMMSGTNMESPNVRTANKCLLFNEEVKYCESSDSTSDEESENETMERNFVAETNFDDEVKFTIHMEEGFYDPIMKVESAYDLSVMNFKSWYDLQLNPQNHNSITIDKTHSGFYNYVSKPYYPLVTEDSVKPGIDFTTQYIHPSARKYLYNVNNPSYYYLYKESLTGSEFSELAKKLLYPFTPDKKLSIANDNTISDKKIANREVPANYEHIVEVPYSEAYISITMTCGGMYYPFHIGALSLLSEYNIVNINTPLLGTSAGSIAATNLGVGMDFYEAMGCAERVMSNLKNNGTCGRITNVVKEASEEYFPDDSHDFLNNRIGKVIVGMALFKPWMKISYINEYYNKEDFIGSILSSIHFPKYSSKRWKVEYRGKFVIDGGVPHRFSTGDPPPSGGLRTVYLYPYFDKSIHEKFGFNNAISQYSHTKIDLVNLYLLVKMIQSRFLLIKHKLKHRPNEWKRFINSVLLYCKHLIHGTSNSGYMKALKKYMDKDETELIKKFLADISKLDKDLLKFGIVEWIFVEQERIVMIENEESIIWDNFSDIDSNMLVNIKNILKSPEDQTSLTALKKLVSIISEFLINVLPPMALTYYYTETPSILYVPYTFFQDWGTFFSGDTTEGSRSRFDDGRAAAYRWIILEYISMENYLYDKYKYYLRKINQPYGIDSSNDVVSEPQSDPSSQMFQRKQMYYIADLLDHFSSTKRVGEDEPDVDNAVEGEMDWLFEKRNGIVKKAIEIELLDNTDYVHILTHTHHWLNI